MNVSRGAARQLGSMGDVVDEPHGADIEHFSSMLGAEQSPFALMSSGIMKELRGMDHASAQLQRTAMEAARSGDLKALGDVTAQISDVTLKYGMAGKVINHLTKAIDKVTSLS